MTIKLASSEGIEFTVEKKAAQLSVLLKNLLEDIGESENVIPLPNVSGHILERVIEWCVHHLNDPDSKQFDSELTKLDKETLFELILAANYLDIKPLLDLTCQTAANLIKGKTTEEIKKIFNIVDEEEHLR